MEESTKLDIKQYVKEILETIDREREREIIARRFGLYDRKETLEQIGELLGITRERVRQLEKAILIRLKLTAEKDLPHIDEVEKEFIKHLSEMGRAAKVGNLAKKVCGSDDDRDKAHVAFLATLAPQLTVVDENDDYNQAVAIKDYYTEDSLKEKVTEIVKAIKDNKTPLTIDDLHKKLTGYEHPNHVLSLATISKHLATLKNQWGYIKWPLVNPRNIRDKIYVILQENEKPMHFSEISGKIKDSEFKRKDVTTQAIHNELIKDPRFVLIGRGIYALKEWGYSKGTVSDIITSILKKSKEPMHRDDIVREVLKSRQVKETTILLNLQGKKQFKRVAKATYALVEV
jgi:DNA-directed RNA polymerase delta subunit